MSRLSTMSRFEEPDEKEPKKVGYCSYCEEGLYEGFTLVRIDNGHEFCDSSCLERFYGAVTVEI